MQDEMIVSEGLPKHHAAAQPHTADLLLRSACSLQFAHSSQKSERRKCQLGKYVFCMQH